MRILALSPHLDDAVVSAGAALHDFAAAGHEVVVHTVLAGLAEPPYSPLARGIHYLCRLRHDPVGERRREDVRAVHELGATAQHGDLLDAIYRHGGEGWQFVEPASLTEPHTEATLFAAVTRSVEEQLGWAPDLVLTAAAIGGHVDHVLVRDAVLAACAGRVTVRLWQDLPYAGGDGRMPPLPPGLSVRASEAAQMSADGWAAKCAAVAHYTSQTRVLWPDHGDCRVPLQAHARAAGNGAGYAELFWPVRAPE
jgi:LmbE family N-acetylglucosaminyl deacetylase